jgi:hypothetical protein
LAAADHSGRIVQAGGWVGTATSDLNMGAYNITGTGTGYVKTVTKTLSADGTGADCAIVGNAANSLGHANGCTIVTGVAGKVIIPIAFYVEYTRVTASYTGGTGTTFYYGATSGAGGAIGSGANTLFVAASSTEFLEQINDTMNSGALGGGLVKGAAVILASTVAYTQPGTAAGTAKATVVYYELTPP